MTDPGDDAAGNGPRVRRQPPGARAGEPRRRLQFGTGYPRRGPAPACRQRLTDRAPASGRLRVLNRPVERSAAE